MSKKQIFVFIIDSMNYEDFKYIIKNKKEFPYFNSLINKSIQYQNFYCNSSPTESAMPSIFSSTLPFDYNTQQYGIISRETKFINKFIKNNFKVKIYSNTGILSKLYGYDRKFNQESMHSIEHTWRHLRKNYIWHFINNNNYTKACYKKVLKDTLIRFYKYFIHLLDSDQSNYSKYILDLGKHKKDIKLKINIHLKFINKNFDNYINNFLNKISDKSFSEFFYTRNYKTYLFEFCNKKIKNKKFNWKEGSINIFNKEIKFDNILTPIGKVLDKVKNENNFKRKNISFIHCMDLHHDTVGDNFFINKVIDSDKKMNCLKYIEKNLEDFDQYLSKKNLDFTIILTSDHGSVRYNGYGPLRNNFDEGLFHNAFIKIPLLIYNKNSNRKSKVIKNIHSSSDLLRIISDNIANKFNKISKGFIICEHCGRGSSLVNLMNEEFYVCVVSLNYKLIFINKKSIFDLSKNDNGFFLYENNNFLRKNRILYKNKEINEMKLILNKRLKEINNKIKYLKNKWKYA